jgi:hypothetical protein
MASVEVSPTAVATVGADVALGAEWVLGALAADVGVLEPPAWGFLEAAAVPAAAADPAAGDAPLPPLPGGEEEPPPEPPPEEPPMSVEPMIA